MDIPTTNPVGVPVVPPSFSQFPRAYSRHTRALAALVLGALVIVSSVTTAMSLGTYCLTTDTANTQSLPAHSRHP